MTIILGAGHSINLDSIGCFRSEIARVCNEPCDSLRRWHGDQVKAGRLQENRDFVVVREAPDVQRQHDDVFYFLAAIELCRVRRSEKWFDINHLALKPLRDYGFEIVEGRVVRRNQLSLLSSPFEGAIEQSDIAEADNSDIFATMVRRRHKGTLIPQRVTDGYIHVEPLCRSEGRRWREFEAQFQNSNTELGAYLALQSSILNLPKSYLIQKLCNDRAGIKGTWMHPRIARRFAGKLSPELADAIYSWNLDIVSVNTHSHPNMDALVDMFVAMGDRFSKLEQRTDQRFSQLERKIGKVSQKLESFKGENLKQAIFSCWNQSLKQHVGDLIPYPFESWTMFKERPTKATRTANPFIYVIVVYPPHDLQGHPDIFYVGISGQQPSNRFSDHDGLKSIKALESYQYKYEVYYYESPDFQHRARLERLERGIQFVLDPYWLHATADQHRLLKQGSLLTGGLFRRLYTREELFEAS